MSPLHLQDGVQVREFDAIHSLSPSLKTDALSSTLVYGLVVQLYRT